MHKCKDVMNKIVLLCNILCINKSQQITKAVSMEMACYQENKQKRTSIRRMSQ